MASAFFGVAFDARDGLLFAVAFATFACLILGILYQRALTRLRWRRPETELPATATRLSVVIPARNEEFDLERGLRSILGQRGVTIEVFLVNDHSADRTGAIAEEIARSDPRLTVIHDPPLAPGWLGKCNAMQTAAGRATGQVLLFTDADVIHSPESFRVGLAELERDALDFVCLFPRFDHVSLIENVITPMMVAGTTKLATRGISDPRSPDAFAAGAYLMVRAEVFRAVGGFEEVRTQMLDDVEFARLLKKRGYRVWTKAAPDLLQVRMFKGNRQAFWGTTKNALAGIPGGAAFVPLVILWVIFLFWSPLVAIGLGLAWGDAPLVAAGAIAYFTQFGLLWMGHDIFAIRPHKAAAFPLVPIVVACCLTRAAYFRLVKGAVFWRGRAISVAKATESHL